MVNLLKLYSRYPWNNVYIRILSNADTWFIVGCVNHYEVYNLLIQSLNYYHICYH